MKCKGILQLCRVPLQSGLCDSWRKKLILREIHLTAQGILLPVHFAEVETLPSPVTLVNTLERFRPDVVLLDMNFNTSINTGNEGLY